VFFVYQQAGNVGRDDQYQPKKTTITVVVKSPRVLQLTSADHSATSHVQEDAGRNMKYMK